jgi:hypothetical protein
MSDEAEPMADDPTPRHRMRVLFWSFMAAFALYLLWGPTLWGPMPDGYVPTGPTNDADYGCFAYYSIREGPRVKVSVAAYDKTAVALIRGPSHSEELSYIRLGFTINATFLLLGLLTWKLRPSRTADEPTKPPTPETYP